jgi:hypothetical protein
MKSKIFVMPLFLLCLVSIIIASGAKNDTILLSQENGKYQNQPDKQYPVGKIDKISWDFDSAPLKRLKKAHFHKGLLYLLDNYRNKIYVTDTKGKFVRTIGGKGDGPGEFQNPRDFFISKSDTIYVLNCGTNRIESFDLEGNKIESIILKNVPFEFSIPGAILYEDGTFYIGGRFNHLIATFDCDGNYIDTILKRKKPLKFPGSHTVFEPQLTFTPNFENIIIFDFFNGIFGRLDKNGEVLGGFSFKSDKQNRMAWKIKKRTAGVKTQAYMGSLTIQLWSPFCVDKRYNFYTIPFADRGEEKGKPKTLILIAFSQTGQLLYKKELFHKYFAGKSIQDITCCDEYLLIITNDFDFITINWR